jgi:hypothetical protein
MVIPLIVSIDSVKIDFNGHFRILIWRYLPYIRPKFQKISPQNMALYGTVPPF